MQNGQGAVSIIDLRIRRLLWEERAQLEPKGVGLVSKRDSGQNHIPACRARDLALDLETEVTFPMARPAAGGLQLARQIWAWHPMRTHRPIVVCNPSPRLQVSQRAPFGLVLLFQFALPSEVPGYVLGIVRYHFGRYIAALSIVELPFAVGTVYLGAGLLARRAILIISIGAAGALLIALAFHLLHKRLAAEREAYRTRREARS